MFLLIRFNKTIVNYSHCFSHYKFDHPILTNLVNSVSYLEWVFVFVCLVMYNNDLIIDLVEIH